MSERSPEHPIFAALYDTAMRGLEEDVLPPHRECLARDLRGEVVDVGSGTGAMFHYYADHDVTVHAVEPDPYMRRRAEERAEECDVDVVFHDTGAEELPFDDDGVEYAVSSIVLCTVPEPGEVLDEVARVLAPGGELRFLEHVHADGAVGALQTVFNPVWRRCAGNCHLDRDTVDRIARHPGFTLKESETTDAASALARPFVRGTAVHEG